MSSPPSDLTLEGLIGDNWNEAAAWRKDVVALLEPYREWLQNRANDYNEYDNSWRTYRAYELWTCVPDDAMNRVDKVLSEPYDPYRAAVMHEASLKYDKAWWDGLEQAERDAIERLIHAVEDV